MKLVSFEFKARLQNEKQVRAVLKNLGARFIGTDRQVDTYFQVSSGRLKIREGRIENALISYRRSNTPRTRRSTVDMMLLPRRNSVRTILATALPVQAVVEKRREIYFVGNAKIHLDKVRRLGKFLEVEAISRTGDLKGVRAKARRLQKLFGIRAMDVVGESYADLIARQARH